MKKTLDSRLRECLADPKAKRKTVINRQTPPERETALYRQIPQPPERETASYQQTLLLAKREARRRSERKRAGFGSFLIWYMKHSCIRIWLAQAVMLSCIGMLLLKIYDVFYLITPRRISMLLCGLAVLIFMTAIPVFYRSVRYKMQEIEAAAKLSVSKLFLAEMITTAVGDAVMIGTVMGITVLKASYSISSALLYLVVPFLVMWCVIFRLLRYINIEKMAVYGSVICLTALLLIGLTGEIYPAYFEKTFSAGWAGVSLGLFFLCMHQSKEMLRHAAERMFG